MKRGNPKSLVFSATGAHMLVLTLPVVAVYSIHLMSESFV
jgi:hypothetical protein